ITTRATRSLEVLPPRPRNVRTGGGGALLTLVLERAADQRGAQPVRIRRLMCHHEVLATRLPDQARISAVTVDVLADLAPHVLKHFGRASEVNARELVVAQDLLR